MKEVLLQRFYDRMVEGYPEIVKELEKADGLRNFLHEKISGIDTLLESLIRAEQPSYSIEEECIKELVQELGPSKFYYIESVLLEEFEEEELNKEQIIELIQICQPLFEAFDFSASTQDDQHLRYTVTGTIAEYLENVKNGLPYPTKTKG